MNTYSPEQVALRLGASRGRVTRAAKAAGLLVKANERVRFTEDEVVTLTEHLGVTQAVAGLSRTESVVLAELSRRPNGLVSFRAIARACAISPAAAAKATRSLVAKNLATETPATVALGRAREVSLVKANVRHPDWSHLLDALREIRPATEPVDLMTHLPAHLRHAFWNVDDTTFQRLNLTTDAAFIAARALSTSDPNLLSFAASHLKPAAWGPVANLRGLTPQARQTALNLADAERR